MQAQSWGRGYPRIKRDMISSSWGWPSDGKDDCLSMNHQQVYSERSSVCGVSGETCMCCVLWWKQPWWTSVWVCACSVTAVVSDCNFMDCSLPGSSVRGILQARILEWGAMPSSRDSPWPRSWTWITCASCIAGRFFTHWATWEANFCLSWCKMKLRMENNAHHISCSVSSSSSLPCLCLPIAHYTVNSEKVGAQGLVQHVVVGPVCLGWLDREMLSLHNTPGTCWVYHSSQAAVCLGTWRWHCGEEVCSQPELIPITAFAPATSLHISCSTWLGLPSRAGLTSLLPDNRCSVFLEQTEVLFRLSGEGKEGRKRRKEGRACLEQPCLGS